jgi:hypothetical protein
MAALDDLPPDQRAVLQLVLRQGRSLDDLAALLRISPDAVRERARIGAEALAPPPPAGLEAADRGRIALWLLGQDGDAPPDVLRGSESARAWAGRLHDALAPLARHELPAVPPVAAAPAPATPGPADDLAPGRGAPVPRVSRLGGALLLGGLAIALVALVVWLIAGRDDHASSSSAASPAATSPKSTQGGSSTGSVRTVARVSLNPPEGARSKALGLAQLAVRGKAAAFLVAAQGLTPQKNTYFAFWVIGGSEKPGFLGAIRSSALRRGRLAAQARVPSAIASYTTFLVTREPVTGSRRAPAQPGPILLAGPLRLTGPVGG